MIINFVPGQFDDIFIVCDTYLLNSNKGGERKFRGEGKRYVLKSASMKLPSDMTMISTEMVKTRKCSSTYWRPSLLKIKRSLKIKPCIITIKVGARKYRLPLRHESMPL